MNRLYLFGEWKNLDDKLTNRQAQDILKEAGLKRPIMAQYPLERIFRLLDIVRQKWADPKYRLRLEIEEGLIKETGFSRPMIALGFNELQWSLNPELLERKLCAELGNIPKTAGLSYEHESRTLLRWHPAGVVVHVLAGNVFVGAAGALVQGLVTKNVNIFKMSSAESLFLPALIASIKEADADGVISRSIAAVNFSSDQADVIAEFKKGADAVAVWGGEQAVRAWRNDLPAKTRLIVFGPKLSLAVITKAGLDSLGLRTTAQKLAADLSIWDQNACTAPQVCYIEGADCAKKLAEAMTSAMESEARRLPPGALDQNSAVEIRKLRSIWEIAEARGEGLLRESAYNLDWTVVMDRNIAIEPSPLHRTIRLVPFQNLNDVFEQISLWRGYIQTVGLAARPDDSWELAKRFEEQGVLRITELGAMASGEITDPHDGSYSLPQFMNLTMARTQTSQEGIHPIDAMPAGPRQALIAERLRRLIGLAKKSKFYAERLKGIEIETTDDLAHIPILTRNDMEKNMPPAGVGLSTGEWSGGYISRSGGSTGEPKFSIYDKRDWEELISNAVRVFRAMGLRPQDKVANCMLAGDLYGSFISFDHINCRLGAATFAFANSAKPETLVDTWRKFKFNVIEGVPTTLMILLKAAKKLEPSLTIEKIIYGGSPLTPTDRQWLEKELGVERIASVIGANDGGQIAYQCHLMKGSRHHAIDDFNYLEIVDEKGARTADGSAGRILITSLLKFAFPLIRYDLEDMGRFVPETCLCGRTSRIIEYLGRTGDVITVGLMNVHYRDFSAALDGFPWSALQIAAQNKEGREILILRAETEDRGEGLRQKIRQTVLDKIPRLAERLKEGNLAGLEIELHTPGSLPRNQRSGKIKNVVDERR